MPAHVNTTSTKVATTNTTETIEPFSPALSGLSFTFLILILVMAIFGNVLVILAFKKFPKLRTVTNYFVVSLAISDVLVSIFSMPLWAAYLLTGEYVVDIAR